MNFKKTLFSAVLAGIIFSGGVQNLTAQNLTAQDAAMTHANSSASSLCADIFLDFFTDICCSFMELIWIDNHFDMEFDDYPYANSNEYIINYGVLSESEPVPVVSSGKFYRFTFETGAFFFPANSLIGNETRAEGYIYKFFGPVFENIVYTDIKSIGSQNAPATGNLKLGGTFNLLNLNPINIAMNCQWSYWYGQEKANGIVLGLIVRSYPVKPFMLEWRGNMQLLDTTNNSDQSDSWIFESHLETGVMTGRLESYGAWKYIYDRYYNRNLHAVCVGVKLHI